MKRFILPLLLIIVLPGCISLFCEKGSGKIISLSPEVSDFTSVRLEGTGNIKIVRGESETCTYTVDDNLADYIKISVDDGTLVIGSTKTLCPTELSFLITMKDFNGAHIEGSGDITVHGPFGSRDVSLKIDGSGDIACYDITAKKLEAIVSGSGNIKAEGETDNIKTKIEGSGDIDLYGVNAKSCDVTISGSGDCKLVASEYLDADISGSGNVYYKGNPRRVKKDITGSGAVIKSR